MPRLSSMSPHFVFPRALLVFGLLPTTTISLGLEPVEAEYPAVGTTTNAVPTITSATIRVMSLDLPFRGTLSLPYFGSGGPGRALRQQGQRNISLSRRQYRLALPAAPS